VHVLVFARHAAPDRHHVASRPIGRVDRSEDVVEEGAFVEVGVADLGVEGEQHPRHLDHVVHVARLGGPPLHHVVQLPGLAEVLVAAVAAGGEAVVERHLVPEEGGGGEVGLPARVGVARERADQLRHERVAVLPGQDVLAPRERADDGLVVEAVGERQPPLVAGVGVQVHEDLVHPPELGVQHPLRLAGVERGQQPLGPHGEPHLDLERLAVAGEAVGVAQPRVDLVQDVPGRPEAIQVEAAGADDPLGKLHHPDLAVHSVAVGLRPDVAVALLVLNGLQFAHEVVGALLEAGVARRRIHQAHCGEVVPCDVTGQLASRAIPPVVALGLRLEAGALAEEGHHAVGLERQQVLRVEVLRTPEGAAGEADVGEREGPRLLSDNGRDRVRRGLRGHLTSEEHRGGGQDRQESCHGPKW